MTMRNDTPALRALFDTTALNWFTDNPSAFEQLERAREAGAIRVLVTPEAAAEIRATSDPSRRADLEAVLARFPLTPTRIARSGTAISGLALSASDSAVETLDGLGFLRDGPDRLVAANTGGYRCDFFVTRDAEMAKQKLGRVEAVLGGCRVVTPEVLCSELGRRMSYETGGSPQPAN